MAAGLGFKTFTTGEVLTAGDVNGYLMQGINVFASEAARNAAITAPQEGQFAFTKDTNSLWYYTGSAWAASGATGDIEGVTAGVGISGGGTSGTVTVTNSMATAIDAKGDLVPGTGADTFARLAVGANGTILTADSAEATGLKWAAASSGAVTLIATTTLGSAAADITFSSISGSYQNLTMICQLRSTSASNQANLQIQLNGDTGSNYWTVGGNRYASPAASVNLFENSGTYINAQYIISGGAQAAKYSSPVTITIPNYKGTTLAKTLQFTGADYSDGPQFCSGTGGWNSTAAITSIKLYPDANNFKAGCSISLYGWS